MGSIFIKGKNLDLIVLEESDALDSNWYKWFNSERTTQYMQKHYFPNTRKSQLNFVKNMNSTNKNIVLGVNDKESNLVGVCSLNDINYINKNCTISLIIGEKVESSDVSLEIFYLLLKHAFFTLNLNKVKMGQHKSLKLFTLQLYKEFGFIEEGVLKKEIHKNGVYIDIILSSVFKKDFIVKMIDSNLEFVKKNWFIKLNQKNKG